MPISTFLDGHNFDSETRPALGVAFEMARVALRFAHSVTAGGSGFFF